MKVHPLLVIMVLMVGSTLAAASEQVETFESAVFSNHKVIVGSRSTDKMVVAIGSGGVDNMKEVTGPAALFIGFDPSDPVTEFSIKMVTGQPFTLTRLRLSNQFEMQEDIQIKALRSGQVVGEFSSEVPWPEADVLTPAGSSFRLIDEVRVSASDLYFYLEEIGFDLEGAVIWPLDSLSTAQPVPLFGSWQIGPLMAFLLGLFAWASLPRTKRTRNPVV